MQIDAVPLSRRANHSQSRRWTLVIGPLTALGIATAFTGGGSPVMARSLEATTPGVIDYTVPAGVCSITVTARGGSGGTALNPIENPGLGAIVQATIEVTPGETLVVTVAGAGTDGTPVRGDAAVPGGFGGGGDGHATVQGSGGGGGGASDVRQGGSALSDRVIVAGGGGGGGGGDSQAGGGAGGDAGHPAGDDGSQGGISSFTPVFNTGGGGGTQSAGGAGGELDGGPPVGSPGAAGLGGAAATSGLGGGGGGGYFGGGGGTAGASFAGSETEPGWFLGASGGGGGSSFAAPGATDVAFSEAEAIGDGSVTIDTIDCDPPDTTSTTTTTTTTTTPDMTTTTTTVVSPDDRDDDGSDDADPNDVGPEVAAETEATAAPPAQPVAVQPTFTG